MSESISIILIIFLMLVAAMIIYVILFGFAGLTERSAFIAMRGNAYNTSSGAASLALFHMQGDTVSLNASPGSGFSPVQFTLQTPYNTTEPVGLSPVITDSVWQSGDTVYLYQDGGGFWVTDNINARIAKISTLGPLIDMQRGVWTVNVIDTKAKVLIATIPIIVGGSGTGGAHYSPGLLGTYYNTQSWTSPLVTNIARQIHFADTASGWASDVGNWPVGYIGKTDSFSVKYDGLIKIDTADDYTFYLTSDDGSFLDIDGSQVINNGGLHGPQMRQATVHLLPGYHPISVEMFENTGGAVIWLEYSAPTVGARQIVTKLWHIPSTPPSADFTAVPRAGPVPLAVQFTDASTDAQSYSWNFGDATPLSSIKSPAHTYTTPGTYTVSLTSSNSFGVNTASKTGYITVGSFAPGFLASYYRGQSWSDLAGTRIDSGIHYSDSGGSTWPNDIVGRQNDFSVLWDGYLLVSAEADYSFTLTSDDGSWLWVDETQLIDNGGDHGSTAITRSTHLTAGYHHIVVKMYENGGSAIADLSYSPGGSVYHIPSTAPVTDFTAVPRAGPAPLNVQFADASLDATGWSWNFGDGSPASAVQNPAHTYAAGGSYTVTLTGSNAFGTNTATKTGYITVGSFVPGFLASYYRGQIWTDLAGTRNDAQIQFSDQGGSTWPTEMVGRQDDFSVLWDGYLQVTNDNTYTFYLTSDDGSYLWVDEAMLVDNGGFHASQTRTGSVHLTPGYHHIVVKMYENGGQAVAWLEYSSPGMARQNVADVWHM